MTKPSETDLLLAELLEGETVESVMEHFGLSSEEASGAIAKRDKVIDATIAAVKRARQQGRNAHIGACTQWIECIDNGCSCPCHGD